MGNIRNIGIITAGGDCGGLNAVVRGAALMAESKGIGALVIPNGYAGLYNLIVLEAKILNLSEQEVKLVTLVLKFLKLKTIINIKE